MKKRKSKLVPLTPVLERLGACLRGLAWLRERNAATFREAYASAPYPFQYWVVRVLDYHRAPGAAGWMDKHHKHHESWRRDGVRMDHGRPLPEMTRAFPPESVERALYNYAKREGLA